jgi:hypothetical protein
VNRRRIAALLRELAAELERDEEPANDTRNMVPVRSAKPLSREERRARARKLISRAGLEPDHDE